MGSAEHSTIATQPFTPAQEAWRGALETFPMLLGSAPFGIIFGALAATKKLSAFGAVGMSVFVYAGSSQFIALTLLAGGTGLALIVATTFIVNLRHMLYAATLLPHVKQLSKRWRVILAFWLTDETFAVVQRRYSQNDTSPYKHWYHLGSGAAMYFNWVLWSIAGVLLGQSIDGLEEYGLEFAMIATFIGIVIPLLRDWPAIAAAVAAATVALVTHHFPYKIGLILAALSGVVTGVMLESIKSVQTTKNKLKITK